MGYDCMTKLCIPSIKSVSISSSALSYNLTLSQLSSGVTPSHLVVVLQLCFPKHTSLSPVGS